MNVRVLMTLAIIAAAASLAAVWAVQREVKDWRTPAHGKLVFPKLADRLDDVGKLTVRHAGHQLTIRRNDSGWVLLESDGYPVQAKTVQVTLVALSELRWLEPKTRKPDRYAKLEVRDAAAKDAKSRRIQVFDNNNEKLADLIVGRENVHLQVISEGGVYVRKPGEKQAWLAGGQLVVGGEPKDWLANRIVNLPRAQIARAVIRHPNGDVITVENTSTSSTDKPFEVTGLPPEKKLADKFYPTDIGRALEDFTILDAREANKIPFPKNRTVVATFDSVDGLVVRMQVTTVEEDRWATLGAEATSSSDVQVQRAAKEIAARVNGWAFRIPEFEAVHIVKPLAKIVEPATSKPPEK